MNYCLYTYQLAQKMYQPKYEEGELVQIAKPDETFRKVYKQNYTDEVSTIFKVATTSPPTCNHLDAFNVIIEEEFHEPESVQVSVLHVED